MTSALRILVAEVQSVATSRGQLISRTHERAIFDFDVPWNDGRSEFQGTPAPADNQQITSIASIATFRQSCEFG